MKKKTRLQVSLKDIAKELDISTAAVSKALNDVPGVSNSLRIQVKKTAETMGYTRFLKAATTYGYKRGLRFIVVLYGRVGTHIMEQLEMGIDEKIRKKGFYELRYLFDVTKDLYTEERKELFLNTILKEKGVAGFLSCYLKLPDALIAKLYERKLPIVLLENHTDFGKCVTIDNFGASYKVINKLIELDHKKIGCIMPHEEIDHVWADRLNGYKKALKDKGITYDPSLIVYENWVSPKDAGIATKELLERNPGVTAILYGSDRQAYGGMKMLHDLGKQVPEDIAVIGFDDTELNKLMLPPLSSIRQPIKKMAELGTEMLFEAIEKNDFSHKSVVLNTELILRKSCLKDYEGEKWA